MTWFKEYTIEDLHAMANGTILEVTGIEITAMGENTLSGKMPVDERTKQPAGILHGGASVVLAETLGSVASYMLIDPEKYIAVGQSINANHIRPGISGYVYGKCEPVHLGSKSHVRNIEIVNEEQKLVCVSRLTMAIIEKK